MDIKNIGEVESILIQEQGGDFISIEKLKENEKNKINKQLKNLEGEFIKTNKNFKVFKNKLKNKDVLFALLDIKNKVLKLFRFDCMDLYLDELYKNNLISIEKYIKWKYIILTSYCIDFKNL